MNGERRYERHMATLDRIEQKIQENQKELDAIAEKTKRLIKKTGRR